MNPPSAYLMAKGSRLELEAMSKLDLTKEASDNGIGNNQGYNLALFPNQKKTSSMSSWPSSMRSTPNL